jgi:anion-transporting  ArsA/GET3 family ATPase
MQLLIFSGESHTLQSAAAVATACHASTTGKRVLLVSTGPTHMLGQLLGQSLSGRPLELQPNLAAMEMVAIDSVVERWDSFQQNPNLRNVPARIRNIGKDELPVFPGIDLVSLQIVAERAEHSGLFDLMVCDGPSPDSLVRELTLPDALRWMVRLIFGLDRGPGRSRRSQETSLLPASIIPAEVSGLASVQNLRVSMDQSRTRFLDSRVGTRMRMVLSAEELPMANLRQMLSGLGLHSIEVDTLLVRGTADMIDAETRTRFEPLLLFDPLPITPTNLDGWSERGAHIYSQRPAGLALPEQHTDAAAAVAEQRELLLHIPFVESKDLDIAVANEEVVVRLNQFRRHILLPGLAEGGKLRARVEGEHLRLWVE